MLAAPLPYKNRLMGVIECINHESGNGFTSDHIKQANEVFSILGHALVCLLRLQLPSGLQKWEVLESECPFFYSSKTGVVG